MLGRTDEPSDESLATRALALVVCVPVFELSLYLGLVAATGSGRVAARTWLALPTSFHLVYLGVAAAFALTAGMGGLTSLLGHLFLTHHGTQRDLRVTVAAWAALVAATLLALWSA